MKKSKFFLPVIILFVVFMACNDDDENGDDPIVQTSEWNFTVTINITDPDVYSFDAVGVALIEATETTYAVEADYTIGGADFTDVIVEGDVNNGEYDFQNKTIEVLYQFSGNEFTEIIDFSITDMDMNGDSATGTGTISIERTDTGAVESGTLEFTATKI